MIFSVVTSNHKTGKKLTFECDLIDASKGKIRLCTVKNAIEFYGKLDTEFSITHEFDPRVETIMSVDVLN